MMSEAASENEVSESVNGVENGKAGAGPVPSELFQQVIWLLTRSDTHKFMFLADLEWSVIPPYRLRQFRIFHDKNTPMAFATWAAVSDVVLERMKKVGPRLRPDEWNSGKNVVLMDIVAPFGGVERIVEELNKTTFKGGKAFTVADLMGEGKTEGTEG